jgi:hypothetical protein
MLMIMMMMMMMKKKDQDGRNNNNNQQLQLPMIWQQKAAQVLANFRSGMALHHPPQRRPQQSTKHTEPFKEVLLSNDTDGGGGSRNKMSLGLGTKGEEKSEEIKRVDSRSEPDAAIQRNNATLIGTTESLSLAIREWEEEQKGSYQYCDDNITNKSSTSGATTIATNISSTSITSTSSTTKAVDLPPTYLPNI